MILLSVSHVVVVERERPGRVVVEGGEAVGIRVSADVEGVSQMMLIRRIVDGIHLG